MSRIFLLPFLTAVARLVLIAAYVAAKEKINVYIYEFLSNEYRRSFVEMHYKLCDLMFTDKNFGNVFSEKLPTLYRSCPFPKGVYRLENISFPDLPILKTFPFQKGRIFVNMSHPKESERMVEGYIDLVIKTRWR